VWHDASDVTQTSVRRFIAQQLGFAATYVADVLGPAAGEDHVGTVPSPYDEERRPPAQDLITGGMTASPNGKNILLRRDDNVRSRRTPFGPPTLKEFEAQQRLEACFAPGGVADVQNDWGWTIAGHHVKIFSLDVTAPLYVERLQRIIDVEVIGRSHDKSRPAKSVS
jgi:hypothetical protein